MAAAGVLKELQFFGLALLRGVLILVLYDLLRIFRRVFPHGIVLVSAEDLGYWAVTALLVFQLIYQQNDGAVRGYALLAVMMGMAAYHWSVSDWIVEQSSAILKAVVGSAEKPIRAAGTVLFRKVRQWSRFYKKKLKNKIKEFIIILFS